MKFNYINISLFPLSLNILLLSSQVYDQRNHNLKLHKPTTISRLLCECELYAPANYDNDPEMKEVMQDFDRQISQRLEEYNKGVIINRQKCKEKCDKEVQKIILKDKIEKELTKKFATLDTHITTNDIPTCVCKKSFTDKTEKFCHNCGYGLGSVATSIGLLGGPGIYGWKTAALITAKELAKKAGSLAGEAARIKEGIGAVVLELESEFSLSTLGGKTLKTFVNAQNYKDARLIYEAVYTKFQESSCIPSRSVVVRIADADQSFCNAVIQKSLGSGTPTQNGASMGEVIKESAESIVSQAKTVADAAAETAAEEATNLAIETNTATVDATYASSQIAIIASVAAIMVIVLVMVIIYLILRYRRKKKMKKKLQYIKLLKE